MNRAGDMVYTTALNMGVKPSMPSGFLIGPREPKYAPVENAEVVTPTKI
jgi:hypothetical protein